MLERLFTYRLHAHDGDDLGLLEHPAPNIEPGDDSTETEPPRRPNQASVTGSPRRIAPPVITSA